MKSSKQPKIKNANSELEKQKFLYKYWYDAEKIELGTWGFITSAVLIPTILNVDLNFNNWTTWALIIEIVAIILIGVRKINKYRTEQTKIKNKVEKLEIL